MRGFVLAVPRCRLPAGAVVCLEEAVAASVSLVEDLDERYISGCPAYTPRWFDRQAHHTVSYCWADEEAIHRHIPLRLTALPRLLCRPWCAYPVALLVDADREKLVAAVIAASVPVLLRAGGVGARDRLAVLSCSSAHRPCSLWRLSEVAALPVHDRCSF